MGEPEGGASEKSSPVPLRLTVWVLPVVLLLLSVIVRVPLSGPLVLGVKLTLIVHEPPAVTLLPQLLVWPKLLLAVMLLTLRAAVPLLFRVTACDALLVFTNWPLKVKLPGEVPAIGATWDTVRLKVEVTELTPVPLAVIVIV
jgi:hypothetical protein